MKSRMLATLLLALAVASALEATADVQLEWVTIGDAPNSPDGTGYGAVDYAYRVGKFEVTNSQYTEFLKAVAKTDTHDLFDTGMESYGITRSSSLEGYVYAAKTGWADRPVNYIDFYDALRFANWLHNGQPTGPQNATTTEDGAYNMSLGSAVARKSTAQYWLLSENEWYKAAYYKGGSGNAGYWEYATRNDAAPTAVLPAGGSNSANYNSVTYRPTIAGAYTSSYSAYGTFDQDGNVWEWNEAVVGTSWRGLRGGAWTSSAANLAAATGRTWAPPDTESVYYGFRLGTVVVPEPTSVAFALCVAGALPFLGRLRRRRS